jgi:hypothetical protein
MKMFKLSVLASAVASAVYLSGCGGDGGGTSSGGGTDIVDPPASTSISGGGVKGRWPER